MRMGNESSRGCLLEMCSLLRLMSDFGWRAQKISLLLDWDKFPDVFAKTQRQNFAFFPANPQRDRTDYWDKIIDLLAILP